MSATKKVTSAAAASSIPSGSAIISVNSSGAVTPVSTTALQSAALDGIPPACMLDGVFIMYHDKVNNRPQIAKIHNWTPLQASGEVADGVVVVEGGKVLVVAPTECVSAGLMWSSATMNGGAVTTSDRVTAMNDWNGKDNTAAIINASTSLAVSNTADYAPGFCKLYSHGGLGPGKWWLPSAGELLMIFANMSKINYALTLIPGATQLSEKSYWSSDEFSMNQAWSLNFLTGYLCNITKNISKNRVRPVSAFIS